jgi:hypothetical protein
MILLHDPRRRSLVRLALLLATISAAGAAFPVNGQSVEPPYDTDYTLVDLGSVPGLPLPNGGLTFMPGDPDTILIGGEANFTSGMLYTIHVARDAELHITGFVGTATVFAEAPYNDGGVAYGPGGVLFLSRFPENEMGQIPPGETTAQKVVDLSLAGVDESPGGLNFVPLGFPGAGALKLVSWADGRWYTLQLEPDGAGTWDVVTATVQTQIGGGPEGFVYVPAGSPQFPDFSAMLVSEWSAGEIAAYIIDGNGDPDPASRATFVSGLEGAEGAAIDPLTGDFLFSTFSLGSDHVFAVQGFAPPETPPDDTECPDSHGRGPGYWHRQCLGLDADGEGIRPGRRGRGPRLRHESAFESELMPCTEAWLEQLGFLDVSTCDGLDAHPPANKCEQAMRRLTSVLLDVCSGRVRTSCPVDAASHGCSGESIGGVIEEAAGMIHVGACRQAAGCLVAPGGDDAQ